MRCDKSVEFEAFVASHGIAGLTAADVLGALEEGIDACTSVAVPVAEGDVEHLRRHGGRDARAAVDGWDPAVAAGRRALAYTRTGDRLLPVLPEVVAALPRGFSPAAVARMRSPWEELGGQSIAGCLGDGGAPEVAAELVAAG